MYPIIVGIFSFFIVWFLVGFGRPDTMGNLPWAFVFWCFTVFPAICFIMLTSRYWKKQIAAGYWKNDRHDVSEEEVVNAMLRAMRRPRWLRGSVLPRP